MRAFFITTETNNCDPVVESFTAASADPAWSRGPNQAVRFKYWCEGYRRDGDMVLTAEALADGRHRPEGWDGPAEVAFYIGACVAPGNPGDDTLAMIGRAMPLVHICFDGGDSPWWPVMERYRRAGVFRAQVNIDGAECPGADLVTLCPVDPRFYAGGEVERDIALGFSGNLGSGLRQQVVGALVREAGLQVRPRASLETADYPDYAQFMRRCRAVVNIPVSGSGQYMHVKARIVEAGLAGAAVLEHEESPAHKWFPGALISYGPGDLIERARGLDPVEVAEKGAMLAEAVRARHMPEHFWGAVLDRVGL